MTDVHIALLVGTIFGYAVGSFTTGLTYLAGSIVAARDLLRDE